ncbi:MAG: hypothetical protein V2A53_03925 [bacterium]
MLIAIIGITSIFPSSGVISGTTWSFSIKRVFLFAVSVQVDINRKGRKVYSKGRKKVMTENKIANKAIRLWLQD